MARPEVDERRKHNPRRENKIILNNRSDEKVIKLLIIYLGFLLIKAVLVMLPALIKHGMFKIVPRRQYTAEEVIACGHMRPDLYYQKQLESNSISLKDKLQRYKLKPKEIITLEYKPTNTYKEVDINVIRDKFKIKMQHRELTRSQIIAIRRYLECLIDCKGKKFSNDCHCIYWCLKRLSSEQVLDLHALENLLK